MLEAVAIIISVSPNLCWLWEGTGLTWADGTVPQCANSERTARDPTHRESLCPVDQGAYERERERERERESDCVFANLYALLFTVCKMPFVFTCAGVSFFPLPPVCVTGLFPICLVAVQWLDSTAVMLHGGSCRPSRTTRPLPVTSQF